MKNLLLVLLGQSLLLLIGSCTKDTRTVVIPSATIAVVSPFANQVYKAGDTVVIAGTITGDVTLHGYHVAIVNQLTGDTVFHAFSHEHAARLAFNEHWVNALPGAADLRVYISSAINHDGLVTVKSVDFRSGVN
jgi:hypothetical protein